MSYLLPDFRLTIHLRLNCSPQQKWPHHFEYTLRYLEKALCVPSLHETRKLRWIESSNSPYTRNANGGTDAGCASRDSRAEFNEDGTEREQRCSQMNDSSRIHGGDRARSRKYDHDRSPRRKARLHMNSRRDGWNAGRGSV